MRKFREIVIAIILFSTLASYAAVVSRVKVWTNGETLTASDLNAEFDNLINAGFTPSGINDYSNSVSQMQETANPGTVGGESLSTTLADELKQIRYMLKWITGGTQWYDRAGSTINSGLLIGTANIPNGTIVEADLNASIAGSGLTGAAGSPLAVNVDNATLEINTDTLRIKDAGVTRAKLVAVGQQLSSSSGTFNFSAATYADVTNLTVTITTTGRPVWVGLVNDGSGTNAYVNIQITSAGNGVQIKFLRDAVDLGVDFTGGKDGSTLPYQAVPVGGFFRLDTPVAGTYTYKVQAASTNGTSTCTIYNAKLLAYEL